MKKRYLTRFSLWILVACMLMQGCDTTKKAYEHKMGKLITEVSPPSRLVLSQYYLVIPNDGCGPCFDKSISFAKRNIDRHTITFVFTTLSSLKNITTLLSSVEMQSPNVILDNNGVIAKNVLLNGHTTLLQLSDSKVIDSMELTPENISQVLAILEI